MRHVAVGARLARDKEVGPSPSGHAPPKDGYSRLPMRRPDASGPEATRRRLQGRPRRETALELARPSGGELPRPAPRVAATPVKLASSLSRALFANRRKLDWT